jgi:hypothetical protein
MHQGDLFKSSDGGMSWNHVRLQVDGWNYGAHVIDPIHAWATLDEPFPTHLPGGGQRPGIHIRWGLPLDVCKRSGSAGLSSAEGLHGS